MKKIFISTTITFLILSFLNINAQEDLYEVAKGGPEGIFLNLGVDLPSSLTADDNISAYRIERKTSDTDWKIIADYSAPISKSEFIDRLKSFDSILNSGFIPDEEQISFLWDKIMNTHRLDSLGYWSNYLIIRLAAGAVFYDDAAEKGEEYQYRISLFDNQGNPRISFLSNMVSFPGTAQLALLEFTNSLIYENALQLKYVTSEGKQPSLIYVYRKELRENDFQRINPYIVTSIEEDQLEFTVTDSTILKDRVYEYYLVPADYYGNKGEATKKIFIGSYNFQQVPLPQNINAKSSDSLGGINLTWQLLEKEIVKSVKIFRSEIFDSSFNQIAEIPSEQSTYADINIEPMKNYYYYLQLVGPLNEVSAPSAKVSGIFENLESPVPPYGLKSEQIDKGIKLTWNKNDENIKGYYVYRKDPAKQEFAQISDLVTDSDSVFSYIDTSSTLSGKYSYAYYVRSENIGHLLSATSDTAFVVPSKSLKPMAPQNLSIIPEDSILKVYWNNMIAADNTIAGFNVFRKTGAGEFTKLNNEPMNIEQNFFIDTTVQFGNNYFYAVQSVDLFENTSDLSSPVSYNLALPVPPSPGIITAINEPEGIKLSWEKVLAEDIIKYNIYRYQRGEEIKLLSVIDVDDTMSYLDKSVDSGELYFYQITAVNKYKKESKPSPETGIRK